MQEASAHKKTEIMTVAGQGQAAGRFIRLGIAVCEGSCARRHKRCLPDRSHSNRQASARALVRFSHERQHLHTGMVRM